MEEKQTVAEMLSITASLNVTCYMYDTVHMINDVTTPAEIADNKGMFDWATAIVTHVQTISDGDLVIEAVLQSSVERSKRLENAENLISSIDEDIVAINDMLQQPTADLERIKEYVQHISNHIKQHKNMED